MRRGDPAYDITHLQVAMDVIRKWGETGVAPERIGARSGTTRAGYILASAVESNLRLARKAVR